MGRKKTTPQTILVYKLLGSPSPAILAVEADYRLLRAPAQQCPEHGPCATAQVLWSNPW